MIKFEHGMLVLAGIMTKDDVNAINEFADNVRKKENERTVKLLEANKIKITGCCVQPETSCCHRDFDALIALIEGEKK